MFIWQIPDDYSEDLIGVYDSAVSPDRFAFLEAREVQPRQVVVRFACRLGALLEIDDLASTAMVPIVSERLQEFLQQRCPGDFQFIDTRIVASDGESTGFRLLNVTSAVSAIDHEAAKYSLMHGSSAIMSFQQLALRPGALGGRGLARAAEYMSLLLVSESLGQEMLGREFQQVQLLRPEDVRP